MRKRLWPWFEAPPAGWPMRYDGWVWDPKSKEWVTTAVEEVTFIIKVPKYPKPTREPRPAQPLYMPGWYWNGRRGVWEETTMPFESVLVIPERPPMPTEWPSRTQPAEVPGWRYSFMYEVWEKIPMEGHTEMVEQERGPMPEYVPGTEQSSIVEGWSWSEQQKVWAATIIIGEPVGFTPDRSFPPGTDSAAVNLVYPMTEQYLHFYQSLINMGLDPDEAKRIGGMMVDGFWNMSRSALTKQRAELYRQSLLPAAVALSDKLEALAVSGAVLALAAIAGALIGSIAERLTFPADESFSLSAPGNTYLLGPGNWEYSRNIGRSMTGRPLYSSCGGIGTEYTRHRRGWGAGATDIIDFPGGFVEEGYQFPYFVKYTWSHWYITYVGMLFSAGQGFYALKEADLDSEVKLVLGESLPYEQWCSGFDYYL